MSAATSAPLSSQIRTALSRPEVTSWPVVFWFCVGFAVRSGTVSTLNSHAAPTRIVAFALACAVVVTVMLLARATWLRPDASGVVSARRTLGTFVGMGVVTSWLGLLVQPVEAFGLAVVTRTIVTVAWFVAMTVLLDQRDSQLKAVASLFAQQHRLEQVRATYRDSLDRLRTRLAQVVDDVAGTALRGSITRLHAMLAGPVTIEQVAAAAAEIRAEGVGVVRLLGHDLDKPGTNPVGAPEVPVSTSENSILRKGRSDSFGQLIRDGITTRPFWPAPLAVIVAVGVASVAIPLKGILVGLGLTAILASCVWLAAVFGRRFVTPWLPRIPFVAACLGCVLLYSAGAGAGVLIAGQVADVNGALSIWLAYSFGLIPMYGSLAVYDATVRSRRRCLEDLSHTLEAISWEVARLADDELTTRRAVAMLLHGNTQSRMAAVAMKLDQLAYRSQSGATVGQPELRQAVADSATALEQAVAEIQSIAAQERVGLVHEVRSALESIASSWRSIAVVQIDCPVEVAERVNRSRSIATAVAQTAREAITNAIRHGGANRIDIVVRLIGSSVEVRAVDNGRGPDGEFVPGLGITAMIRTGGSVQLTSAPTGGAELVVLLPIGS